jgi:hypothetical protein
MRLLFLSVHIACCSLLSPANAFSPSPRWGWVSLTRLAAETGENASDEEPPSLLIGSALNNELAKFKSKYPTSESDYLAAARRRAEERCESTNSKSSDDDWKEMAKAKQAEGVVLDDWEQSLVEAGNADSQILIPIVLSDDSDDGEEPEPKLLLF